MAVIHSEYFSQAMVGFRSFTAVLPVDLPPADGEKRRYVPGPWPTLYLLHGYTGSRSDWLRDSPIEVAGNAAWHAPSGSLSAMFQAGALIELTGNTKTAYAIYYDTYDIHDLTPLRQDP